MKVRLRVNKNLEIRGKMKTCRIGQIIDVGKGSARAWIARGEAETVYGDIVPGWAKRPSPTLLDFRNYWYSNRPGDYDIGNPDNIYPYSQIWEVGGPNPMFNDCKTCQDAEWISRLAHGDAFPNTHNCSAAKITKKNCERQGDGYLHRSQNYLFAAFTDDKLSAPRCLMAHSTKGIIHVWSHSADQGRLIFVRQFAIACQYDIVEVGTRYKSPRTIENYDFIFTPCSGSQYNPFPKSDDVPLLMYGHDLWKRKEERQAMINDLQPDIFWTPYLSSWKAHYRFPAKTEIVFRPIPAGTYFTKPNLDEEKKKYDLLIIGSIGNPIYQPRKALTKQIGKIADSPFRIYFHNIAGASRSKHTEAANAGPMPFLTAWSEFLGSSRYVIFDGIAQEPQPIFFKYYEVLGSGAVPIFPNAPDLSLLGIEPWKHFIPVEEYRNDNEGLKKLLREDHSDIARNAVGWYWKNADVMLYDWFEDMVHGMINSPYQKRRRP